MTPTTDIPTWRGKPLRGLFSFMERALLQLESVAGDRGPNYAKAALPSGARLSLRRRESGRLRLWIYRTEPPMCQDWRRRFEVELNTFRKHFDIEHWTRIDRERDLDPEDAIPPVQAAAFDQP